MSLTAQRRKAASGRTRSLVALMHGYGADGNDLIGLAEPLAAFLPDTTFLAPDAPSRCGINPMGYQWFPIPWIDGSTEGEMESGFAEATRALDLWLGEAMAEEGVTETETVLVGFSQGTMMALHVGPRRTRTLAGIVGFSGRLIPDAATAPLTRPPVLLIHGDRDEVIPVAALEDARAGLAAQGFEVRTHVSRGAGHGIAPDGLQLAAEFIVARLCCNN